MDAGACLSQKNHILIVRRIFLGLIGLLFATQSVHAQVPVQSRFPVVAGNDDAEEAINSGSMDIGSSDLELIRESSEQLVGIRFADIQIPQGATIDSAYIQFTVDETDNDSTTLIIHGEDTVDPAPYSIGGFDISSRSRTADSVLWSDIPAWTAPNTAGPDQRTPDLRVLIEKQINDTNWQAGQALAFIISGEGKRTAISKNKGAADPPVLVVHYQLSEFPVVSFPFDAQSVWKYNDAGTALDTTNWTSLSYDDSTWNFGQAKMGYGDGNERTTLDFGSDANNKYPTYYFRKEFTVEDTATLDSVTINLLRDDGAIVYLNGQEIGRSNMPSGSINYNTLASQTVAGSAEDAFVSFKIGNQNFQNGDNVIAVEVHQASRSSSDIGFDLSVSPEIILPPEVQLIHNAPDSTLAAVDVYVDLFRQGNFVKINGSTPIPFRFATPFLDDLPAGDHEIAISPASQSDFSWSATPITLENNKRYVAIASGVRTPADYDTTVNGAANVAFQIQLTETPKDADVPAGEAFLLLDHGAPDVPNIRFIAPGVGDAVADLPTGLPFNFPLTGGEVPAFNFPLIEVTNNLTTEVFGRYSLGLAPFSGKALTIVTSGFLNDSNNAGVNEPTFGTFLISEAGGPFTAMPEPVPPQDGSIEIIHESPDPDLDSVDIYLNGQLAVESLGFRQSTGRLAIPSGNNRIAISSSGQVDTAWSAADLFIESALNAENLLLEGLDYTAAAIGVRDTSGFANPENADLALTYAVSEARTTASDSGSTDILFLHGSPNAPQVDFIIDGQFIPLVDDISFGNFSPTYATLPADTTYQLNISQAEDNDQIVKAYTLDLNGRGGEVLTLTASGQLDGAPGFQLYQSDGAAANLVPLAEITLQNVQEAQALGYRFYPNPVRDYVYIEGPAREIELLNIQGQSLQRWSRTQGRPARIDLSAFPEGMYFLRLSHAEGHHTLKLQKR